MSKYCLIYNGSVLFGGKYVHKKSNLWYYNKYIYDVKRTSYNTVLLFDTSLQAKLWVLAHSSFPRFSDYLLSATSEQQIDRMYLKGKYIFNKANLTISNVSGYQYPMVCEIIVSEYEE